MGHMATEKTGQVATHRIPQMAVALGGFFVYTRGVGEAVRAQSNDQNTAEQRCRTGGVHQTRNQASEVKAESRAVR
jgi:hypothetical protein